MKMPMFKRALLTSLCGTLVACGGSLDQAGIDTSIDEVSEELIFDSGEFVRKQKLLSASEGTEANDVQLLLVLGTSGDSGHALLPANADIDHVFGSQPLLDISEDAEAPISITGVWDTTGTIEDQRVLEEITRRCNLLVEEGELAIDYPCYVDPYNYEPAYRQNVVELAELVNLNYQQQPIVMTGQNKFKYELLNSINPERTEIYGKAAPLTQEDGTITQLTVVAPRFSFDDDDWDKTYRAVLNVAGFEQEFIAYTATRNPAINDPGEDFFGVPKNNLKPGRSYEAFYPGLSGFNTQAELVIEKLGEDTDYDIEVSIKDADHFEPYQEGAFKVRADEAINIKFVTQEGHYSESYQAKVTIRDVVAKDPDGLLFVEDTIEVNTHSSDYVPGPENHFAFPPMYSSTSEGKITLSGSTWVSMDQINYDDEAAVFPENGVTVERVHFYLLSSTNNLTEQLEIEEPFETLELSEGEITLNEALTETFVVGDEERVRHVYDWTLQATLYEWDSDNVIVAVAESDLSRQADGATFYGMSEPEFVTVSKAATIDTFPASAQYMVLSEPRDVTIDTRSKVPTLYIGDGTHNSQLNAAGTELVADNHSILWSYPLSAAVKPACSSLVNTFGGNIIAGVQFNHARPEIGGVFVSTHQGRVSYLNDTQMAAGYSSVQHPSRALRTEGEGPQYPSHSAFDRTGTRLFVASQSRGNFSNSQQAFVSMIDPNVLSGEYISLTIPASSDSFDSNYKGAVANESSTAGELNNGVSIDIYTRNISETMDPEYEEWILSLDGKFNGINGIDELNRNNTGETLLKKIKVRESYTPVDAYADISLKTSNGEDITLEKANAIVVDDATHTAYVSDSVEDVIWKFDLTNIETDVEFVAERFSDNDGVPTSGQPAFGEISAMTIEADLGYIIAADKGQNALFAIDLKTGERTYLLKALGELNNEAANPNQYKSICEQ
ncbi:hypothetical protein [Echinimonas agarilytica]|uniref:Uncharacterized protein n=1 Tax=Echinimonas agarilytica TaxID=1215918 RepID=A0AA42B661_9GAMM|nr:hypothetical protein [Echinimonas agarilytica]MCM2678101.1 hypothetical protein [Echinimonas agarilytica]